MANPWLLSDELQVFGRQKVEPEAKEETPGAKPEGAPAAAETQ